MDNTYIVEIDRKNLYSKQYENKKCKNYINNKIYIKDSLIELFSIIIEKQ